MTEPIELQLAAQVREIRTLAPVLADEKKAHDDALHRERLAESKLLMRVAEDAKPALPAISTRVEFFSDQRGVLLFDGWKTEKPGDVRGRRAYLLVDGTFAETWRTFDASQECKGECSSCEFVKTTSSIADPHGNGYFIKFRSYTAARCLIRSHDPKPLITGLHSEMKKQRGKRVVYTVEAQKSTAKLNAIITLLG